MKVMELDHRNRQRTLHLLCVIVSNTLYSTASDTLLNSMLVGSCLLHECSVIGWCLQIWFSSAHRERSGEWHCDLSLLCGE